MSADDGGAVRRIKIGTVVISGLGLVIGCTLIICGSLLEWSSDRVLGVFSRSGWEFDNIVRGDGRMTLVLGIAAAAALLLGALARSHLAYGVGLALGVAILALGLYELVFVYMKGGIDGPGLGLLMVIGGAVAYLSCALGGFRMTSTAAETADGAGEA